MNLQVDLFVNLLESLRDPSKGEESKIKYYAFFGGYEPRNLLISYHTNAEITHLKKIDEAKDSLQKEKADEDYEKLHEEMEYKKEFL
jgi:hypothetical protein